MLEPTRRGRSRRLVRELFPVGAAAGAAALAVTFIVGGTTAELVSPAQQGPWPVATSPSSTGTPSVITNAPAPRRDERARIAGFGGDVAAGPVAIVTGSLTAPRAGGGVVGADGGRPIRLAPAPAPAPSSTAELAAPPVLVPVAAPVASAAPVETSVVTAATTARRPGRSASAPGRSGKTSVRRPTVEAPATGPLSAAGTSVADDPGKGDAAGQGRENGPGSAPGRARAAERSAGQARSQRR